MSDKSEEEEKKPPKEQAEETAKKPRVPEFEDSDLVSQTQPENRDQQGESGDSDEKKSQEPRVPSFEEEEKDLKTVTQPESEPKESEPESPDEEDFAPPGSEKANFADIEANMAPKDTDSEEQQDEGENNGRNNGPKASAQEVNYVTSDVTALKVGDDIGLTNKDPTLRKVFIGAGWEVRSYEGDPPDLDLSCFILNKNGKTRKDPDFVFYNNMKSEEGELVHLGDSRTGAMEGDDESVRIDLQAFPFDVTEIMLVISIHDGEVLEQNFSMVKDLFIRIVNDETSMELCKLEFPENFFNDKPGCAMRVGRIFRDGPKWRFHAGTEVVPKGGLRKIATDYDILVV